VALSGPHRRAQASTQAILKPVWQMPVARAQAAEHKASAQVPERQLPASTQEA
jgi:hypothetical protein